MAEAVDYSWARPAPLTIALAGYQGALRYLSNESGKNISKGEADALAANGLALGLVWETTANMMLRGANGGRNDSIEANRQADAIGFPADRPIFYACDFQPMLSQYTTLEAYLVATGGRPWGFYGPYDIVEWLAARHPNEGRRFWQCAAWSGNGTGTGGSIQGRRVSASACLYQKVGYVLGNTCDANVILQDDWGQHPHASTPTSTSAVPATAPASVHQEDDDMPGVPAYKLPNEATIWTPEIRDGHLWYVPIAGPPDVDDMIAAGAVSSIRLLATDPKDGGDPAWDAPFTAAESAGRVVR